MIIAVTKLVEAVTELGERDVGFHSLTRVNRYHYLSRAAAVLNLASLAGFERDVIRERTKQGRPGRRPWQRRVTVHRSWPPEKLAVARQMLDDVLLRASAANDRRQPTDAVSPPQTCER